MDAGDLLLKLALLAALISGGLFLFEWRGRRAPLAGWTFVAHAALLVIAFGLLVSHFLGRHFEYGIVEQYSSRALSPALTVAATWAGQEGSILLWATFVSLLGLALMRQPGRLPRPSMAFIALAQVLLLGLLMVKSPFARTALIPHDGKGLNPLLDDPWMVVHPPVLFLGYAAAVVPFALAATAILLRGTRDWNRVVWPWALATVITLGTGITLGGVWAYRVLGWGGYWAWDPVENASFVPWLLAVALLHGLMIQRVTGGMIRTNLVLSFLGWISVLGGTYLTRSGVLQDFSVHSFTDSGLNVPLVFTLVAFTAAAALLLVPRWRELAHHAETSRPFSRESALWLGMITVLCLAGLVAIGTSAPLITKLFGRPANVQAAFYQQVSLPLGIALVLLMGLSPALRWNRQRGRGWLAALVPGLVAGPLLATACLIAGMREPGYLLLAGFTGVAVGVNAWFAVQTFRRGWMYGAGYLGHVGIGVMILGIVLSSTLGRTAKLRIPEGGTESALGHSLTYRGVTYGTRGEKRLDVRIERRGWTFDAAPTLLPAPQMEGVVRKPAIHATRELYLSPVEVREEQASEREPVWLSKGQTTDLGGGVVATFRGFRMESTPEFRVYADLELRQGGLVFPAAPALVAGPKGTHTLDARVDGFGTVSIARIDADRGRVALNLPATAAGTVALLEFSTKPFINLVWVGVLLTFFGTAISGMRRAGERKPLAARISPPRERSTRVSGPGAAPLDVPATLAGGSSA